MKKLNFIIITATFSALVSCGSSGEAATAEGFLEIEKDIKSKFGDDAYFTDLTISYNEAIGNVIGVTVTDDPESLTMGEWSQTRGAWEQKSEITLELPPGTKAADFMFQLDNKINLSILGGLIEKSKKQLIKEKDIENPSLFMASIIYPDDGDISKAEYLVMLEPENGGTSFNFYYNLDGVLREMTY